MRERKASSSLVGCGRLNTLRTMLRCFQRSLCKPFRPQISSVSETRKCSGTRVWGSGFHLASGRPGVCAAGEGTGVANGAGGGQQAGGLAPRGSGFPRGRAWRSWETISKGQQTGGVRAQVTWKERTSPDQRRDERPQGPGLRPERRRRGRCPVCRAVSPSPCFFKDHHSNVHHCARAGLRPRADWVPLE